MSIVVYTQFGHTCSIDCFLFALAVSLIFITSDHNTQKANEEILKRRRRYSSIKLS
jgi:hypothetical protein